MKITKSSQTSALIDIGANNNKVISSSGNIELNLTKSKNIKKIIKSQNFGANFLSFDARDIFVNLNFVTCNGKFLTIIKVFKLDATI